MRFAFWFSETLALSSDLILISDVRPGMTRVEVAGCAIARSGGCVGRSLISIINDRSVMVAGHDAVIGGILSGGVSNNNVTSGIGFNPAVVTGGVVVLDPVARVNNVDACAISARSVATARIIVHERIAQDSDTVAPVVVCDAILNGAFLDVKPHSSRTIRCPSGGPVTGGDAVCESAVRRKNTSRQVRRT
jgi:hypothetical protein